MLTISCFNIVILLVPIRMIVDVNFSKTFLWLKPLCLQSAGMIFYRGKDLHPSSFRHLNTSLSKHCIPGTDDLPVHGRHIDQI